MPFVGLQSSRLHERETRTTRRKSHGFRIQPFDAAGKTRRCRRDAVLGTVRSKAIYLKNLDTPLVILRSRSPVVETVTLFAVSVVPVERWNSEMARFRSVWA